MGKNYGFGVIGCGSIAGSRSAFSVDREDRGGGVDFVLRYQFGNCLEGGGQVGAKQWFTDYHEMLDRSDGLRAVIIATPNNMHRNQAIAAAKRGLHVVVEKPLAITSREAWDIVNACREYKVKLMVGCDRRFWTQNQWAKKLVEDGVIGDVLMSRASLHEHWFNYQNHVAKTDFRLKCEVAGGAAISRPA